MFIKYELHTVRFSSIKSKEIKPWRRRCKLPAVSVEVPCIHKFPIVTTDQEAHSVITDHGADCFGAYDLVDPTENTDTENQKCEIHVRYPGRFLSHSAN